MRLLTPTVRAEGDRVAVSARIVSDAGRFEPAEVSFTFPRALAGIIDPSATPWVPVATVAAAAAGEDLHVESMVSAAVLAGSRANATTMAEWFDWRAPAIDAPVPPDPPARPASGPGHALFFSRGVDSWASFIAISEDPAIPPVTSLVSIRGIDRERSTAVLDIVQDRTRAVAAQLGLPLIEVGTDARDLLDGLDVWDRTHGAVLAAVGLLLGPAFGRVTVSGSGGPVSRVPWGSHPEIEPRWSSERTAISYHLAEVDRTDKVGMLARSDLALESLFVCWRGHGEVNCGRCAKCLRTMTALQVFGLLDRATTFAAPLSADAVRRCPELDPSWYVDDLIRYLPPGEMRLAWERHLPSEATHRRFVAQAVPSVVGPQALTRVSLALAATGQRTDPSDEGPDLVVGWESGMVPLRPAAGQHRRVAAAVAAHQTHRSPWVVADPADPHVTGDAGLASVAERAEAVWGPGIAYLAGIGWADTQDPVVPATSVGRMLDAARVRLWWAADGSLDAVRVLESIEHGCLPLQVMPAGPAERLRGRLPVPLAPLVVDLEDLAGLDPFDLTRVLADAAGLVLRGSAERDMAVDALALGIIGHG